MVLGSSRAFLLATIMTLLPMSRSLTASRFLQFASFHSNAPRMAESIRKVEQARHTYFDQLSGNSAGFRRARKPYQLGNFLLLLSLCAFTGGVYAYSIFMVCILLTYFAGRTR